MAQVEVQMVAQEEVQLVAQEEVQVVDMVAGLVKV